MEKEQDEKKDVTLMDAMEDFFTKVYPTLFVRKRKTSKDYQRVHSLLRQYRKALKGEARAFTPDRAIRILNDYAGEVNGVPRYSFEVIVLATIEGELP